MELPLTYNYSKLNNVTITTKMDLLIHYVQKPSIKLINFLQDFTEAKVTTKSYNTDEFNNLLTELYSNQAEEYDLDDLSNKAIYKNLASSIAPSEDILDDANEGPIIKLINATIAKAIKARASDIHLEPFENFISIRFRVDGVLSEVYNIKATSHK